MNQNNVFITTDNFLLLFHEGIWTDGDLSFGSDPRYPKMDDDAPAKGRFVPQSTLEENESDRYTAIMNKVVRNY